MHYAKTWKRYTWDDMIMIFSPMDGQAFDPTKRQIINFLRHDMKSCRENHGKVKGQPPFLSPPLVPFNMIPQSKSPLAIMQRIEKEERLLALANSPNPLAIEDDKNNPNANAGFSLQYGSYVTGYNAANTEALCKLVAQIQADINYITKA